MTDESGERDGATSNSVPTVTTTSTPRISDELRTYYDKHGIDVDRLVVADGEGEDDDDDETNHLFSAWRFIRLNPRFDRDETLSRLKKELAVSHSSSIEPQPVSWLDEGLGFFSLPGDFRLAQSSCYREGRIYGMDISSGAAVAALLSDRYDMKKNGPTNPNTDTINNTVNNNSSENQVTANDPLPESSTNTYVAPSQACSKTTQQQPFRILDMCCAPGLKLCAIADYLSSANPLLQETSKQNVVVGVDVSETRIAICKRILQKYHVHPKTSGHIADDDNPQSDKTRIRLYCCDGTTFDQPHNISRDGNQQRKLVFDSETASEERAVTGKRKRMNKSARARERKQLKSLVAMDFEDADSNTIWKAKCFDKVIVDAECSTDGSLKHIQKQINKRSANVNVNANDVAAKLMDSDELSKLVQLQKNLAASGFRLLKPGGTMIYSTCSLSEDQNEMVVAWLMNEFSETAFVVPISFSRFFSPQHNQNSTGSPNITEGELGVRFHPNLPPKRTENGEAHCTSSQLCFGGGFFLAKIGKRANCN